LILSVSVVAMVLGMGATGGYIQKSNVQSNQAYSAGGTVAEEAFSAIRTTIAFGKQKDLARKYAVSLTEGKKWGIKSRVGTGLMLAWMFFVMWAAYALAFWQGARFYLSGEIPLSAVITVLMSSIIGGMYSLEHLKVRLC
jgi:ATP-binding cassette, subfamily B (MDR/TAP), member 1